MILAYSNATQERVPRIELHPAASTTAPLLGVKR
jgi:hypothetical protein